MANSFGNGVYNEQFWAAQMQEVFFKENVAMAIAKTELRAQLASGDTVHKAYGTYPKIQTYTKGSDITVPDYSGTDESLTVDTAQVAPMYLDDIDKMQNKWDQASVFAKRAGRLLNNKLDQAVLAEYSNANSYISAGDMGGSGTGSFTLNAALIPNLYAVAGRKLDNYDVPQAGRFAIVGPRMLELTRLYVGGRETAFGDIVSANGKVMDRFGFEIYYSNNLPFTATWTPANNPTAAGYITISGVKFTFVATAAAAGDVYIGADTAATLDNLVLAINGTGTASATTYTAITDRNRMRLTKDGIVATDGNTTLGIAGYGDIVVTTSDSNDPWSAQVQYPLFGMKGATNFVLQKSPSVEIHQAEKRLGKYVFAWQMYGKKTFYEDKDALCYAKLNASSWI